MDREMLNELNPVTNWQGYLLATAFVLVIGLADWLIELIV